MKTGELRVVTAASGSPVEVAEAKAHAHYSADDQDALFASLIATAHAWLQPPVGWLGRSVLQQTLRLDLPCWPYHAIRLPAGPVSSVASVKYFDTANVERTVSSSLYFLDGDDLVFADTFTPEALYARPAAVRIQYVAGYTNAGAIPSPIKTAIMMLVAHWFENREAVAAVGADNLLPLGVTDLLAPYRLH